MRRASIIVYLSRRLLIFMVVWAASRPSLSYPASKRRVASRRVGGDGKNISSPIPQTRLLNALSVREGRALAQGSVSLTVSAGVVGSWGR
jgi:hypothetical protein